MRTASAWRIALRWAVPLARKLPDDRNADAQSAQHADSHCIADLLTRVVAITSAFVDVRRAQQLFLVVVTQRFDRETAGAGESPDRHHWRKLSVARQTVGDVQPRQPLRVPVVEGRRQRFRRIETADRDVDQAWQECGSKADLCPAAAAESASCFSRGCVRRRFSLEEADLRLRVHRPSNGRRRIRAPTHVNSGTAPPAAAHLRHDSG